MSRTEDFRAAGEARADVARRAGRTGSGDALTRMVDAAVYRATRTPPPSAEHPPASPSPEWRVLRTPDGTIRYLDTRGDGVPVLLVHEDPATALDRYRSVVPTGARAIAPARYGNAGSTRPSATPTRQADAFTALLDELGIAKAAVVASASVATAAALFAIRYPRRVAALALIAPNGPGHGHLPDITQVTAPAVVAYAPDGPLDASPAVAAAVRALLEHTSD